MARPKKIGLEYFPLDCQMDDKVEMLEAEHGLEGFAVYIKLLQAIYQSDAGELDMAVVLRWKTLGKQYGIPAENLKAMVDTMCEVALFDKEIFIERHVLTSSGIQKRIAKVNALRERDRSRKIEPEEQLSAGKPLDKYAKGKGKEKESIEDTTSSLRSEVAPAAKSDEVLAEVKKELPSDKPTASAPHTRGAADVGTRKKPTPAVIKILMKDSPMADFAAFVQAFEGLQDERFPDVDLVHYHGALLDWSSSNGEKKADWLATARNWMRRDKDKGQLRRLTMAPMEALILPIDNSGFTNRGHGGQVAARTQQAFDMMNAYDYDAQGNRLGRRV